MITKQKVDHPIIYLIVLNRQWQKDNLESETMKCGDYGMSQLRLERTIDIQLGKRNIEKRKGEQVQNEIHILNTHKCNTRRIYLDQKIHFWPVKYIIPHGSFLFDYHGGVRLHHFLHWSNLDKTVTSHLYSNLFLFYMIFLLVCYTKISCLSNCSYIRMPPHLL